MLGQVFPIFADVLLCIQGGLGMDQRLDILVEEEVEEVHRVCGRHAGDNTRCSSEWRLCARGRRAGTGRGGVLKRTWRDLYVYYNIITCIL